MWLIVVRGSLRHRIEKLGVEKPQAELAEPQKLLKEAARAVAQEAAWTDQDAQDQPERPEWARGAFVYLTEEDARRMPEALGDRHLEFQSKHILASNSLRRIVKMALAATPDVAGREGFLLRRAGAIDSEEEIRLPVVQQQQQSH